MRSGIGSWRPIQDISEVTGKIQRIALVGKSGSGKSAVAEILSELLECSIIKTGAICREVARLLFGNEDKATTQRLDDALTALDSSIFLRSALRRGEVGGSFVLDALRFNSDVSIAKGLECKIWRVTAPLAVRVDRLVARGQVFDPVRDGQHRSECELDDVVADVWIQNESDRAALRERVVAAITG